MGCFTAVWLIQVIISIVGLGCAVAILRLLVPWICGWLGIDLGPLPRILQIILGFVICVWAIWFAYDLIVCFASFPRLR